MKNAFGVETAEIRDIARDSDMQPVLFHIMRGLMEYLGADERAAYDCLGFALHHEDIHSYEREAHKRLQKAGVLEGLSAKLQARSELIYRQVLHRIGEGSVLDFGCGDGKVGEMISNDRDDVRLADVYEHDHVKETGLDFYLTGQNECVPVDDNTFDNILALTVFHHSLYPSENIDEMRRVTKPGGKVIVIESVYDVHGEGLIGDEREKMKHFLDLTPEQQLKACCFFDHFFNRVFYYEEDPDKKVTMPNNYNTPENWERFFSEHGLEQKKLVHLGLDQPLGPAEYHILSILKVKE